MLIAFILITVGVIFFLKNVGLITISWGLIWPLILIGIGVYIAVVIQNISQVWKEFWNKITKKTKI